MYVIAGKKSDIWATDNLYPSGQILQATLPFAICPVCNSNRNAVSVPHLKDRIAEIRSEIVNQISDPQVVSQFDLVEREYVFSWKEALRYPTFLELASRVRLALDLPIEFPIFSHARSSPLRMLHHTKMVLPITAHLMEDTLITVSSAIASALREANFKGVNLVQCSIEGKNFEERFELAVHGLGIVHASNLEIAQYFCGIDDQKKSLSEHRKCPKCGLFPARQRLLESRFSVQSEFDFFRLRDFSGIYVSKRAKEFLEARFSDSLEFYPV